MYFRYFVANLTHGDFLKWSKTGKFWICFSVLEHYTKTTLLVVSNGSPRLRITKVVDKKNLGCMKYRANLYQLYENVCQLIAETEALLSALELGQKL